MHDQNNVFYAIALSVVILISWQYFFATSFIGKPAAQKTSQIGVIQPQPLPIETRAAATTSVQQSPQFSRHQALARSRRMETERVLAGYPRALREAYGGYYALGRVFVKAIGRPELMRFATKHGMSRPALMRFALKLLANLTDPRGDAADRLVNGLSRLARNPE